MSTAKWGSVGLSAVLFLALVIWLASGEIRSADDEIPEQASGAEAAVSSVQVEKRLPEMYHPTVQLQGQVEAWRRIDVSARLSGVVEELAVALGEAVVAGDILLVLSEEDRPAEVARARARVRQLEADLAGISRLRSGNLASESEQLRLESELAAARAELNQALLDMDHLRPEAPFDGVINARHVEVGTFVQAGEPLFEVVQAERLKVAGFVPQQQADRLQAGQPVRVRLLDGAELTGELTFVASAADPETRSFRVEARVDNPDLRRIAGASASLVIEQPPQPALFLSPALLSLGDNGRPGILHVNDSQRVEFSPVTLLSVGTEGAWVAGAPSPLRLITRGGGFVSIGQRVTPVPADPEE